MYFFVKRALPQKASWLGMEECTLVRGPTYVRSAKIALLQKASWLDIEEGTLFRSPNLEAYLPLRPIWFVRNNCTLAERPARVTSVVYSFGCYKTPLLQNRSLAKNHMLRAFVENTLFRMHS